MENKKVIFWLKLAFIIGTITDALAVIPMVSTGAAKALWGFNSFPDMYKFAMGIAAVFMTAWTLLLFWAYRNPIERRMVALLTLFVLVSFIVVEVIGIGNNVLILNKTLPTMIMQFVLSILFCFAYLYSAKTKGSVN